MNSVAIQAISMIKLNTKTEQQSDLHTQFFIKLKCIAVKKQLTQIFVQLKCFAVKKLLYTVTTMCLRLLQRAVRSQIRL